MQRDQKNMKTKQRNNAWFVVKVWRGLPVTARAYRCERNARRVERTWRQTSNPEYDEIGVFRLSLR